MEENRDFSQMSSDEIWEILPNLSGRERGIALMSLAHHAWSKHEVDQLMPLAMEAKDLFASLDDKRELAMAYDLIGSAHAHDHNFHEAIEAYNKAFSHSDAMTGESELAMMHRHAADAHRELHQYEEALTHYRASLDTYLSCNETHPAVHSVEELSLLLNYLGRYGESMAVLDQAAQWIIGSVDPLAAMEIQLSLASTHLHIDEPEAAMEHANIALGLGKTCSCPKCPVRTRMKIADCLIAADRTDEAMTLLDEIQELAASTGQRWHVGQALLLKSRILRKTDPDLARQIAIESCSIYLVLGDTFAHTFGQIELAHLKFDAEDYFAAAEDYDELASDMDAHGLPVVAAQLRLQLAKCRLKMGNPHAALHNLDNPESGYQYLTKRKEQNDYKATRLEALYACKRFDDAKALIIDLVVNGDSNESPETLAVAYEFRARMNQNINLTETERAINLSMAHYVKAGDLESAQRVAQEFIFEQQNSLQAITEDNERRAQEQAEAAQTLTAVEELNLLGLKTVSIEELVAEDAKLNQPEAGTESESA